MKKTGLKMILIFALSSVFLTACGSNELAKSFNVDQVEDEANKVVEIVNAEDGEALKEISSEEMKRALTDNAVEEIFKELRDKGEFKEIEDIEIVGSKGETKQEEHAVAVAKVRYEEKTFLYSIIFNEEMELLGFNYQMVEK